LACKAVFAALERDPLIPDKLLESNRNLEWIKACKDQQGSVEQTSLTLVNKINLTGVYTISMPKNKNASADLHSIETCIKMSYEKVSSQSGASFVKTALSLEDLQELRSKLMLITAGADGKKDVDRFAKILSLVELVTKHFRALVNAGCHLFANWELKVIIFHFLFHFSLNPNLIVYYYIIINKDRGCIFTTLDFLNLQIGPIR